MDRTINEEELSTKLNLRAFPGLSFKYIEKKSLKNVP